MVLVSQLGHTLLLGSHPDPGSQLGYQADQVLFLDQPCSPGNGAMCSTVGWGLEGHCNPVCLHSVCSFYSLCLPQAAGLEKLAGPCRDVITRMLQLFEGLPEPEQAEYLDVTGQSCHCWSHLCGFSHIQLHAA